MKVIKKIFKVSSGRSGKRGLYNYPQIGLKGKWIEDLGFFHGDEVMIFGTKGVLKIYKALKGAVK